MGEFLSRVFVACRAAGNKVEVKVMDTVTVNGKQLAFEQAGLEQAAGYSKGGIVYYK